MRRSTDHILSTHGGNLPRPADLDALLVKADDHRAAIEARLAGARVTGSSIRIKTPRCRRSAASWPSGTSATSLGSTIRVCGSPGRAEVHRAGGHREGHCSTQGRTPGNEGGRLHRRPRPPELRRRRPEQVLPRRAGLHDGRRRLHTRGIQGHHGRRIRVQVGEPEFATTWMFYPDWSVEQYRNYLEFAVEVINHAVRGLPEEQIRFHMCWGSGHRPHTNDIELAHIVDLL